VPKLCPATSFRNPKEEKKTRASESLGSRKPVIGAPLEVHSGLKMKVPSNLPVRL
jgi:hypothetical protein